MMFTPEFPLHLNDGLCVSPTSVSLARMILKICLFTRHVRTFNNDLDLSDLLSIPTPSLPFFLPFFFPNSDHWRILRI